MLVNITMGALLAVAASGQLPPTPHARAAYAPAARRQTQTRPQDRQPPRRDPALFERAYRTLYRLVWPNGRYRGNLAEKVRPATVEQAGEVEAVPKVYQVNARTGAFEEWPTASGVGDFVVSPDGTKLFYRRERSLYVEDIALREQRVMATSSPRQIAGVEVLRLYACTQRDGALDLWAESPQRTVRVLRLAGARATWSDAPPEVAAASPDPQEVAKYLKNLRSLRSDGLRVWVRNNRLIGKKDSDERESLLIGSGQGERPNFFGTPAWVTDDSDLLFVSGHRRRGR